MTPKLNIRNSVFMLAMAALGSCSEHIAVRTDSDKSVDITTYNSFQWLSKEAIEDRNNPLYYNELNDKRIREAVIGQLVSKGYQQNSEGAKLTVHYHIIIEDKTQIRNDTYSPYWIKDERDVYAYREGTLIVDLMDGQNQMLLWRGWAVSALSGQDQLTEELIQQSVVRIFEKLPRAVVK